MLNKQFCEKFEKWEVTTLTTSLNNVLVQKITPETI